MIALSGLICGFAIGIIIIYRKLERPTMPTKQDENKKLDQWNAKAAQLPSKLNRMALDRDNEEKR